eukprot:12919122-Prorocentrum_lima.AAC.1
MAPIGGRVHGSDHEPVQEPAGRNVPRTPNKVEFVLQLGFPSLLYEDVFKTFELKAVIARSDGRSLTKYCYRANIVYT